MSDSKRVFILGAGFSKPAGMPLATEILPLIANNPNNQEMNAWLKGLGVRLAWLAGESKDGTSPPLNIEEAFHYAHSDIEAHRLMHQLRQVGPPDATWSHQSRARQIASWLRKLEDRLCDLIYEKDNNANLDQIVRWARAVREQDAILTFNYDTLVERALSELNISWEHGFEQDMNIPIFKLHGSIDWIVASHDNRPRTEMFKCLVGHMNDYCLLRYRTSERLAELYKSRHVFGRRIGIAGLGAYKELHKIPGLGLVWSRGMESLDQADIAVIVGYSLSNFDAMAQMQFADVARKREAKNRPLQVIVINPSIARQDKDRFVRVFHQVKFIKKKHEKFDWSSLD
jgi:hypothetical protein